MEGGSSCMVSPRPATKSVAVSFLSALGETKRSRLVLCRIALSHVCSLMYCRKVLSFFRGREGKGRN